MTTSRDFERQLAVWLADDAAGRVPDHLAEVLVRTTATRQRPWGSNVERWLPFGLASRTRVAAPARLVRVVAIVAIILALVAAAVFVAGSRQRRLPPPFGPARNGAIVTGINGDLFTVDPTTGTLTALFTDSPTAFDFGPGFSRDGTRLSYLRAVPGNRLEIVVADADGRHPRVVSPAVEGLDQADWSPDGSRIVFLSRVAGRGRINVVNADGTGLHTLDVPFPANLVSWLPPDGAVILFRREQLTDADAPPAIFTIRPDGGDLVQLTTRPAEDVNDYNDVSGAPDGTRILFREAPASGPFRIHLLDLRNHVDSILPAPPDHASQTSPGFSPDGTKVVYLRFYPAGLYLVVAPADGTSTGTVLPLRGEIGNDGPTINNYFFTPDGSAIVANDLRTRVTWLLPVDGSPGTVLASGVVAYDALSTVQRLAP